MQYSNALWRASQQLARAAPAAKRLWEDGVDHGPAAASLFSADTAAALSNLAAVSSLVTLLISAAYAIWAFGRYVKAARIRNERGARK